VTTLSVKRLVVPPLEANCWIVAAEGAQKAAVIDPGGAGPAILEAVHQLDAAIGAILLTHGHFDHMTAAVELAHGSDAPIYAHAADAPMLARPQDQMPGFVDESVPGVEDMRAVVEGDEIEVGGLRISVLETPGHSPGGVCYLTEGAIFTGDTLFAGGIGRTDLPGGDHKQLMASIRDKILSLPDETNIHPGHGPTSTVGHERRGNPWLAEI
jgi:hydroxyacylglutathione hydrolase